MIMGGDNLKESVANFQLLLSSLPQTPTLLKYLGGKRLEEVLDVEIGDPERRFHIGDTENDVRVPPW